MSTISAGAIFSTSPASVSACGARQVPGTWPCESGLSPRLHGARISEIDCMDCLAPAEQALDVAQLELDIGRTAMVAGGRARCRLHLPQQRVHLLRLEPAAGAHRAVAGHGGGDAVEPRLQRVH